MQVFLEAYRVYECKWKQTAEGMRREGWKGEWQKTTEEKEDQTKQFGF